MKIPSIEFIARNIISTIKRFPFETLCAITATFAGCGLIESNYSTDVLSKVLLCSSIGLVTFLAFNLYAENRGLKPILKLGINVVLLVLLIGYYFTFSQKPTALEFIQFLVLNISIHLLVSFVAFIGKNNTASFWDFNKTLFIRILTSALYSGVLYAGLALAILSVDELFKVNVDSRVYGYLFVFIASLFNTLFFLSGIPVLNVYQENQELKYPKGLKAFTQFVLLPLVSIYLIILLSYETKIIATLSLPYGWVSNLILVFSVAGILSILLVYPIQFNEENKWMRTFSTWFYRMLVPLILLLFWAIGYRINSYGFTHERYYVLLLSIWLTLITIYFIASKVKNIIIIPFSLAIFGLVSVYGPVSSGYVSKVSQVSRLKGFIEQNNIKKLDKKQQREMSSVVDYLVDNYDASVFPGLPPDSFDFTLSYRLQHSAGIMKHYGLTYYSKYDNLESKETRITYYNNYGSVKSVAGYDFLIESDFGYEREEESGVAFNGKPISIKRIKKDNEIEITINNEVFKFTPIDKLKELYKLYGRDDHVKNELMLHVKESSSYRVQFNYNSIYGEVNEKNEVVKLNGYNGTFSIKVK